MSTASDRFTKALHEAPDEGVYVMMAVATCAQTQAVDEGCQRTAELWDAVRVAAAEELERRTAVLHVLEREFNERGEILGPHKTFEDVIREAHAELREAARDVRELGSDD
jgi:hypothetical protein